VVFVHGFNTRFDQAVQWGSLLQEKFGNDVGVLSFNWPSRGDPRLSSYLRDREHAGLSRRFFNQVIFEVLPKEMRVSVVAHSMGSWLVVNSARDVSATGLHPYTKEDPRLGEVILAAADIPTDEFRDAIDLMSRLAHRVSVYTSTADYALVISRRWNGLSRLGTGGDNEVFLDPKVESIDVQGKDVARPSAARAYVDAINPFAWDSHSYVVNDINVLSDLKLNAVDGKPADQRPGLVEARRGAAGQFRFWKLVKK
jgi:esterase/lipase superfamily enzyme